MYQVPGTDIVFACVMVALAIAVAYTFGRIHKLAEINEAIETFKHNRNWLCKDGLRLENQLKLAYKQQDEDREFHDTVIDLLGVSHDKQLLLQSRELSKKHRLAMAKHKAKCEARLATQFEFMRSTIETIKAAELVSISGKDMPDFSSLLSK